MGVGLGVGLVSNVSSLSWHFNFRKNLNREIDDMYSFFVKILGWSIIVHIKESYHTRT